MKAEESIYNLELDRATKRLLVYHRKVVTIADLLKLDEYAIRCTPQLGAKRYEALIRALDKAGIQHPYRRNYMDKKPACRETFADEDIERLSASDETIKKLRKHGITSIHSLNGMTVEKMLDSGFSDELALTCSKALIKYYRKKREVSCDSGIEELHIRRPIMLALRRAGVKTIRQLSGMTSAQIEAIDGIGVHSRVETIKALQEFLRAKGLLEF